MPHMKSQPLLNIRLPHMISRILSLAQPLFKNQQVSWCFHGSLPQKSLVIRYTIKISNDQCPSPMLRKAETSDILQSLFVQKPEQPTAKTQETLSTEAKAFSLSWNCFGSYSSMRYQLSFHLEKNSSRWIFDNCDSFFLASGWMFC